MRPGELWRIAGERAQDPRVAWAPVLMTPRDRAMVEILTETICAQAETIRNLEARIVILEGDQK